MPERARCQGRWSVHTIDGWHKVTTEHDCTKSMGHDRPCRCACGMPDLATPPIREENPT